MFGYHIGMLELLTLDGRQEDVLWSLDGPQGEDWLQEEIELDSINRRKVFRNSIV